MKKFLNNLKWNMIAYSIILILLGIFLVMNPLTSASLLCDIVGYLIILLGVYHVLRYFSMDIHISFFKNDLLFGMIFILMGCVVIIRKEFFLTLTPMIIGIGIICSGINKLQDGINAKRLGYSGSLTYILLAAISIIAGILVELDPFSSNQALFMVMGFSLIYSGVSDLYSTIYLSTKLQTVSDKLHEHLMQIEDAFEIKDEEVVEDK